MRPDSAPVIRLEDYEPAPYRIDKVDLTFKLAPKATTVIARLAISRAEGTVPGTTLVLDGDGLELNGLSLDGFPIPDSAYSATPDRLELKNPPEDPFELEIRTRLDPDANTELMGLYRSSGTYCTQCEAEGFRRITYFLDRPDILSVYTTRIEARKSDAPVLLGNGNPVKSGTIEGTDRHYAIWHDPHPKPSYLFALVAGDLGHVSDTFTTCSGRPVDLKIYVEHGREPWCDWAMDSLKRSMKWDEDVFGCEYDLDVFNIVAVSDFNMGAMENKGLNIFNDKYVLADPQTATDQDYANIEAVIAHEYFHNWTGNRITCRDWFQLCLKEGLTVFRDQEFSSDMRSRAVKRIADVRLLKSHQFPEDAGPLAHPVRPKSYKEINNFYTATVYEKGAEIVRMLKTVLGDEAFRSGMDLYLERHDGEATTIEAFLTCFSEAAAADLGQFARWYEQAGTPQVTVRTHHDKAARELTLELTQSIPPLPGQARAEPAVIPLRFGLIDTDGTDMPVGRVTGATIQDNVLVMDGERQKIVFHNVPNRPVISLLRGFSAPVRLEHHLSIDDLLFMASHDADPFNRWQAVQTVATRDLIHLTAEIRSGKSPEAGNALVGAYGDILANQDLDPAFKAQLLDLPGEADIARDIGRDVDPAAIHKARTLLQKAIAGAHTDALRSLIDESEPDEDYSPDAASAGTRALFNRALAIYGLGDAADAADLIATRYRQATNMTDRLSAMTCLVHQGLAGGPGALSTYLTRYERVSLAMDKWFMVQATAPVSDGLEKVKALTGHPLYDFSNPNRVRALVHAFATGNPTQFARADGAGFEFVADNVLALDARNPQVASRLLTCFRSWRALEAGLAAQAEACLLRVSAADNLSRDTRDIVDRCLQ